MTSPLQQTGVSTSTAGAGYDDNLSNGFASADRKGGASLTLDLGASLYQQLGSATGLTVAAIAEAAAFDRYSGLNHVGLGGRVQVRHKFGLGAQAPWIAVAARAVHDDYNYSYQSGWDLEAGVTAGKQLGERWTLQGTVKYDDFTADNLQPEILPGVSTAAYDTGGWNLVGKVSFLADTLGCAGRGLCVPQRHRHVGDGAGPRDSRVLGRGCARSGVRRSARA